VGLLTPLAHALPHRVLSWAARRLAYSEHPLLKQWLIDRAIAHFGVDLSQATPSDPRAYPSFNALFTRALKPGARRPDPDPAALLMPVDGRISQCGNITGGRIFQAKGRTFTTAELLADATVAHPYHDGVFATLYLPVHAYHRVHMPWTGRLLQTVHVPGRLFSVAPAAVHQVPRLFARNERLICHFETDFGPMAIVMVGALLVSGMETAWGGKELPARGHGIRCKDWRRDEIHVQRFAEMGRFHYGSTVIVLLPPGVAQLEPGLGADAPVRLGQVLARRG